MDRPTVTRQAIKALRLPDEERDAKLDGMANRELAKEISDELTAILFWEATALLWREQGTIVEVMALMDERKASRVKAA